MAKLRYYAVFSIKITTTKREIMLQVMPLNLVTLLTAFTA